MDERNSAWVVGLDFRPDVPEKVRRWPNRVRCYACRKFFGFEVVDLLFCSWACAGRTEPKFQLVPPRRASAEVPRQCRLGHEDRYGNLRYKRRFETLEEAWTALRQTPEEGLDAYHCNHCGFFHLGHRPMSNAEQKYREKSPKDRADEVENKKQKHSRNQEIKTRAQKERNRLKLQRRRQRS